MCYVLSRRSVVAYSSTSSFCLLPTTQTDCVVTNWRKCITRPLMAPPRRLDFYATHFFRPAVGLLFFHGWVRVICKSPKEIKLVETLENVRFALFIVPPWYHPLFWFHMFQWKASASLYLAYSSSRPKDIYWKVNLTVACIKLAVRDRSITRNREILLL